MSITERDALLELARRKKAMEESELRVAGIRKELFSHQLGVVDDESRHKAILGTRRAGKTETWPRYAVITCITKPHSVVRIWAQSRLRAKELMWNLILDLCNRHLIKVKSHDTELRITFENRSEIRLVGADKDKEAQKKRGDKTTLEIVLESQSFGPFLETLVEEVIEPSLFDTMGTVCLEGTPGPLCAGYWFWVTGDEEHEKAARWTSQGRLVRQDEDTSFVKGSKWSCHRWSLLDNPHLPHAAAELKNIMQRKGWTKRNPTYLREYCAIWVTDSGALYFKWEESRNAFRITEAFRPWGPGWSHVLGWDIGFNDAMALVVWGWHENDPHLYEACSWSENHVTSGPVVEKIREFQARFNIVKMVADTGGGGKLFVEEVQSRHGLLFAPAQKTEKYAHVTLMNDDLLTGRIKTLAGSELSRDFSLLIKDRDWDSSSGKPPDTDRSAHEFSHVPEAALYAWRYAYNFLSTAVPEPKPLSGTAAFAAAQEQELLEQMEHSKKGEWWECEQGAEEDAEWE